VSRRLAAAVNLLKTWTLMVGASLVLGALGWLIGGYRLFSIAAFAGLLAGIALYWYADRAMLGIVRARELVETEAPAAFTAADRIAARAGMPRPRLYLIRDGHPRILSAGRGGKGHSLVFTSGLLGAVQPAELEGLIAHEIAHSARRDLLTQTVSGVVGSTLLEASSAGGWFSRGLLFVLGPLSSAITHGLLSPRREFTADLDAADLCESPHGLADALLRLEQANELVQFAGNPALEPLYVVNPFEDSGLAALFSTHPPTGERVARLRALDPEWGDRVQAA
jgi:heat shock protein HtpX